MLPETSNSGQAQGLSVVHIGPSQQQPGVTADYDPCRVI